MKKTITTIILFTFLSINIFAQNHNPESDFIVELIDNGRAIQITGYVGNNTDVRIPPRIRNLPVTRIGSRAFREKGLTSVTFPNSINFIGDFAFNRNNLTNVVLPNGISSIEEMSFSFNKINDVTIPNTVTSIKIGAFAGNNISTIIIPNSVTEIQVDAFSGNNISQVTIGANVIMNDHAFDIGGFSNFYNTKGRRANIYYLVEGYWCDIFENGFAAIIIDNGRAIQIVGFNGRNTAVQIPLQINNLPVTAIGDGVFRNKGITSITIPNSINSIGYEAFDGNFAELYQEIGRRAGTYNYRNYFWYEFIENNFAGFILRDGRSIIITGYIGTNTVITIPAQMKNLPVTAIGSRAFYDKKLTGGITIPNSVTIIGDSAFMYNNLTSLTIPNSVNTIGEWAFGYNQLISITIPNISSIGNSAFHNNNFISVYELTGRRAGTYNLRYRWYEFTENGFEAVILSDGRSVRIVGYNGPNRNLTIPSQIRNQPVREIGEGAFANSQLTNVTIPNSVTSIGPSAFANNQLTNVTIPNSVTLIGHSAFTNNQLTNVTIPNSVTSINFFTFYDNPQLTRIIIGANVEGLSEFHFNNNFSDFYNTNGRRAGTYIFSNNRWRRE